MIVGMRYNYAVTVEDKPHMECKYFMKESRAETYAHKTSSAYTNTQVNIWKWDADKDEWDHLSSFFTCSWAAERAERDLKVTCQ